MKNRIREEITTKGKKPLRTKVKRLSLWMETLEIQEQIWIRIRLLM